MAEEWSWARRLAQPFLGEAVEMGWSGAFTLSILQEAGLGYREGAFYEDWSKALDLLAHETYIKMQKPDFWIPHSWIPEITQTAQQFGANYRYEFDVTFRDKETGEEDTKRWSYSSDDYMSKGMVETEYLKEVPWEVSKPGLEILSVELRGAFHQEGASW